VVLAHVKHHSKNAACTTLIFSVDEGPDDPEFFLESSQDE